MFERMGCGVIYAIVNLTLGSFAVAWHARVGFAACRERWPGLCVGEFAIDQANR